MRVLVAGATGHLGRFLLPKLVAAGHEVAGTTRTPSKSPRVEAFGAQPLQMDALNASEVQRTIAHWAPDAVVHALTALPKGGPLRHSDMTATNHLRREGTRNLLQACRQVGVRRIVTESMVFAYGYRDHGGQPLTEDELLPEIEPSSPTWDHIQAVRELERRTLAATDDTETGGVALRFGVFYGPDGGWDRFMRMLRFRLMALPGGGGGTVPWVHIEDAANGVVAALHKGSPGEIYNIVDDGPATLRDLVRLLAQELDLPPPWPLPRWASHLLVPYATQSMANTNLVVSNEKAKTELGWSPNYPTYQHGIPALARHLAAHTNTS